MMRICGSGLFHSTAKGSGLVISAATSVLETLVLFLMLPLPQGMYFSPLPCG